MRPILLLLLPLLLYAAERLSLLEQMAQPKILLDSAWLANAHVKGYDSSVRTSKQRLQVSNGFGGIDFSRWYFDWNDAAALPFYRGKAPIKHMQRIKLYGNYYKKLNPDWAMLLMASVNATYEEELDGNAVGAGLMGFFSYRIDGDNSLQFGAFANYHPVTTLALPVLGYSYRARANDGFTAVVGFPRAFAGYHLKEGWLLRAGFVYSQAVIRLADDSGIEPAGYVESTDYQASAGLRVSMGTRWEFSGDLLYAFRRDFQIYDHSANEIDAYSIDPSVGAMFRVTYAFR